MTYWIRHESSAVPYDSIVKARAAAVRMIEGFPTKYRATGVMIYANRKGKPEGIVYDSYGGSYSWGHKDKKYGFVRQAIYKNGKIQR